MDKTSLTNWLYYPSRLGAVVLFVLSVLASLPVLASDTDMEVILARSCVGEAGFLSVETGECGAILHVYAKRGEMMKVPMPAHLVAQRYSAALKPRSRHPNRWVLFLTKTLERPKHWNRRYNWRKHIIWWELALDYAKDFLAGEIPDPLPRALHFGGRMDRHRLNSKHWKMIRNTGFLNYFYAPRGI
jgi:hypothetical protein